MARESAEAVLAVGFRDVAQWQQLAVQVHLSEQRAGLGDANRVRSRLKVVLSAQVHPCELLQI